MGQAEYGFTAAQSGVLKVERQQKLEVDQEYRVVKDQKRIQCIGPLARMLLCCCCTGLTSSACQRSRAQGESRESSSNASRPFLPKHAPAVAYPRAAWRLVTWQELDRTILWVSHIVILHEKSNRLGVTALRPGDWNPDTTLPKRTEEAAFDRALKVAEEVARQPETFARLAKTYSDDVVTRDRGGSLGGIRASQLPAEYLDAIAELKAGQGSRVIHTAFGYHIVQWRLPPIDMQVGGKRIAIRYRGTVGGLAGVESNRTRDAALTIAREVVQKARAGSNFDELVRTYSENVDVAQSGDLGVWSTRDPGYLPREVEQLGELALDSVSEPVDSVFGFEVLLRVPAVTPPVLAAASIQIKFNPTLPDADEHSKAHALTLAKALRENVKTRPTRFEAFQAQYCCVKPERWERGKGPVSVSQTTEHLRMGQIAAEPVESGWSYWIIKRIEPASVPSPLPPSYQLPNPKAPDFDSLVERTAGAGLAKQTRVLSREVSRALGLEGSQEVELSAALEELAVAFERHPEPADGAFRKQRMHATMMRLKERMGQARFERFEAYINTWTTKVLLHNRM